MVFCSRRAFSDVRPPFAPPFALARVWPSVSMCGEHSRDPFRFPSCLSHTVLLLHICMSSCPHTFFDDLIIWFFEMESTCVFVCVCLCVESEREERERER